MRNGEFCHGRWRRYLFDFCSRGSRQRRRHRSADGCYTDAQKFCAQKGDGLHPIVVTTQERDIYQSSVGGGFNQYGGGFGRSTMAAGAVNFRFRCGQALPLVPGTHRPRSSCAMKISYIFWGGTLRMIFPRGQRRQCPFGIVNAPTVPIPAVGACDYVRSACVRPDATSTSSFTTQAPAWRQALGSLALGKKSCEPLMR
jgi:hypothetical protein